MKLVTGIEAIQSGKPFKHKWSNTESGWIHFNIGLGSITPHDLMQREFIIKQEPREFIIVVDRANSIKDVRHFHDGQQRHFPGTDYYEIKVREVIE